MFSYFGEIGEGYYKEEGVGPNNALYIPKAEGKRTFVFIANNQVTDFSLLYRPLQQAGVPSRGTPWPTNSACVVRAIRVTVTKGIHGLVEVEYRSPGDTTLEEGNWYISDSTNVEHQAGTVMWKNGTPQLILVGDGGSGRKEPAEVQFPTPVRTLEIQAERTGRPGQQVLDGIVAVNNSTWFGYPKGYWRCGGVSARADSSKETITVSGQFLSMVYRPWMQMPVWYRKSDGRVPDAVIDKLKDDPGPLRTALMNYVNDVVEGDGWTTVGVYPLANFRSIFGIG